MKQRFQGMLIGLLVAAMLFGITTALATTASRTIEVTYGVSVVVDGVRQYFAEDMLPFVADDRTFLPVRGIADALGLDVGWDGVTSTVYLTSSTQQVATTPQASSATGINDEAFARLRVGMSINEVQAIIGVAHTSEVVSEMFAITSVMRTWMAADFSSIAVIFTNGVATSITRTVI